MLPPSKKLFDQKNWNCRYCKKVGHGVHFCPLKPTDPPAGRNIPWVDNILDSRRVDVAQFSGPLDFQEADEGTPVKVANRRCLQGWVKLSEKYATFSQEWVDTWAPVLKHVKMAERMPDNFFQDVDSKSLKETLQAASELVVEQAVYTLTQTICRITSTTNDIIRGAIK